MQEILQNQPDPGERKPLPARLPCPLRHVLDNIRTTPAGATNRLGSLQPQSQDQRRNPNTMTEGTNMYNTPCHDEPPHGRSLPALSRMVNALDVPPDSASRL